MNEEARIRQIWRKMFSNHEDIHIPRRCGQCRLKFLNFMLFCSTGEVDKMGVDMRFLAQDGYPVVPGHAGLVNQRMFDDPGGLSRLNPVVPPRLSGPKLTDLRCLL